MIGEKGAERVVGPQGHRAFRQRLVDGLVREMYGPCPDGEPDDQREVLEISPAQLYGAGMLFPRALPQDGLEDLGPVAVEQSSPSLETEDELDDPAIQDSGRRNAAAAASLDSDAEEQPLNLANEYSPSALGITFRVHGSTRLACRVCFGTYETRSEERPHPRAGQIKANGEPFPESIRVTVYTRVAHDETVDLPLEFREQRRKIVPVPGTEEKLRIHAIQREAKGGEQVISVMAVNHNRSGPSGRADSNDIFFQVSLEIVDAERGLVFVHIDRPTAVSSDKEMQSLDLLYRRHRTYCLGHGCAGAWHLGEEVESRGATDCVKTACIPVYEVWPVVPRVQPYSEGAVNLRMGFLAEGEGSTQEAKNASIVTALQALCDDYRCWIEEQVARASELEDRYSDAARRHIGNCRSCLSRMEEGVRILGDPEERHTLLAFRIANLAMLMQQFHSRLRPRKLGSKYPEIPEGYREGVGDNPRSWRPFQLAFILMNIAAMTREGASDRDIVDLIWFPTGGGKTEAYLGLAAFAIALRRLQDRENAGTTVLMRYTLRLLTAQQFQRASALVMSLDYLRRIAAFDADLGSRPITIGLWVGRSLAPNTRDEARKALQNLMHKSGSRNPFQVLRCPWCGCEMTDASRLGYVLHRVGDARTVRFRCPDEQCQWGGASAWMPIYVIDEDIYDEPPTILLGTVDKFAQIAWSSRVGRLFGIGTSFSPPELIIQDELHLISGPLGTIVGLYETAIDELCTAGKSKPKIVASTATARQASEQCCNLYRRKTFEFPPQGLDSGDSYFAFENRNAPGRQYIGVLATGLKSHATAQVRVCSSLLQAAMPDPEGSETATGMAVSASTDDDAAATQGENVEGSVGSEQKAPEIDPGQYFAAADPYGTLVWYFNSLRELGHAATMCTGDIPEHLKGLCRRGSVPWDYRRRIREYVELTSRRSADEIPAILEHLMQPWKPKPAKGERTPVDVLLATNMISVGVDVDRLGLMVVTGQPKGTAEYIQATSRVGRQVPGLVVTVYNQSKSRDRSHYEQFVGYHQSLYRYVEATSVTPFSPPARERGLRGVLIALARLKVGIQTPGDIQRLRDQVEDQAEQIIARVRDIDSSEEGDARAELYKAIDEWERMCPEQFGRMAGRVNTRTLMRPYGGRPDPVHQRDAWPILTSMRNVDGTAIADVISQYDTVDS